MLNIETIAGTFLFKSLPSQEIDNQQLIPIIQNLTKLLNSGYKLSELNNIINQLDYVPYKALPTNIIPLKVKSPTSSNLNKNYDPKSIMIPGHYYYHSQLREYKKPIYSKIDINGNVLYDNPNTAIQLKEAYYIEDLLSYFYNICNLESDFDLDKRNIGALQHLLKSNTLDEILFLIDIAQEQASEREYPIENPFVLQNANYKNEARNRIEQAKAYFKGVQVHEYLRY